MDVKNTSGGDETLTLSALKDDGFGDITTVHGSVLGTTCGVASGVGTLSGTVGAGSLQNGTTQTIGLGGDYSCQFDATFCAAPGPLPAGTTCNPATGIYHTNTVTPTLTGDEGETVTDTIGSLTVTECVSPGQ